MFSNDTSLGVGYAPYSKLEQLVLAIEETLNSENFKKTHPWMGSDIKIMGTRHGQQFDVTLCIPQIAKYVHSVDEYKQNLAYSKQIIFEVSQNIGVDNLKLSCNTFDDLETRDIYLTAIGSAIESGDEGLVGRGNRVNGVISPMRLMSMEGACGKNPVYHIGKVYYVAAHEISNKIFKKFGTANEVALISQIGRSLLDPWKTFVTLYNLNVGEQQVRTFVEDELKRIPEITQGLLERKLRLF